MNFQSKKLCEFIQRVRSDKEHQHLILEHFNSTKLREEREIIKDRGSDNMKGHLVHLVMNTCDLSTLGAKTEGSCLQQRVTKQPISPSASQIKEQHLVFWEFKQ